MSNIDEKLINYGNLSTFHNDIINDSSLSDKATWSSSKINEEIQAVGGTVDSEFDGKTTEDFKFVTELPQEATEGEQVVIKGENIDTLYKYVSGAWAEQTPDATVLYFDTENEALYSYVSAEQQFATISSVSTIVVGKNLNTSEALKAIKTPGTYSVLQRTSSTTKGEYTKKWTLTVEGIDYEEYELTDSVYQRIQSNYTIQKRTWSSTRATNDGWSSFSTYYAGEIKDSTTSKYYTWSSSKLSSMFNNIPQLEAGENIEIADNKINAKGYSYNEDNVEGKINFVELPFSIKQNLVQEFPLSQLDMSDLKVTGNAGVTTYVLSGNDAAQFLSLPAQYFAMFGLKLVNGDYAFLVSGDAANSTVTFKNTLNASQDLNEVSVDCLIMDATITVNGSANTTTYTFVDNFGMASTTLRDSASGTILLFENYGERKVSSIDVENLTITLTETLDASNPIVDEKIKAIIPTNNISSGSYSHAEGNKTQATENCTHAEGYGTKASGSYSHSEGYQTQASGDWGSHAEGNKTIASGGNSHSEGSQTQATEYYAHAEGRATIASGSASHAEGYNTTASGSYGAHAEGTYTEAIGQSSHAEGWGGSDAAKHNKAEGPGSHVEGCMTKTQNKSEHAEGSVNVSHKNSDNDGDAGNTLSSIGCGIYANEPKNAREIMQNGDCYIIGIGGYQGRDTKVQNASIRTLQEVVNGKQDTLAAGQNISIDASNNISADGYKYYPDIKSTKTIAKMTSASLIDKYSEEGNIIDIPNGKGEGFIFGSRNVLKAGLSTIIGNTNTIESSMLSNFAVGKQNTINGGNSAIAVGLGNTVNGGNSASVTLQYAIGSSLIVNNHTEGALGQYNISHNGNTDDVKTRFSIGDGKYRTAGEGDTLRENIIEVMNNGDMYLRGVGGYDGVHVKSETGYENTKTLQEYIAALETKLAEYEARIAALEGNTTAE